MKIDIRKVILAIGCVVILIGIGIIIGINVDFNKEEQYPKPVAVTEKSAEFQISSEGQMVYDNFWRFVDASYVAIGTPPDCEYYKIASGVPRNNYNVENFYIDEADDFMYYHSEDGSRASHVAIDVSAYQPEVDWEAVKASGVDSAMIRLGYRGYGKGTIVVDDMFYTHIEGAIDAGLNVGVYFFTQALNYDEGVEEAQFVLSEIGNYNITGPVVIDTEDIYAEGARTEGLDVDNRTDSIVGFCETIKSAGYRPMIYANRNWFIQSLDMSRVGNYGLWLAHYTNQPDFPYAYTGWQYTDAGIVDGVDSNVDLNVWFE